MIDGIALWLEFNWKDLPWQDQVSNPSSSIILPLYLCVFSPSNGVSYEPMKHTIPMEPVVKDISPLVYAKFLAMEIVDELFHINLPFVITQWSHIIMQIGILTNLTLWNMDYIGVLILYFK